MIGKKIYIVDRDESAKESLYKAYKLAGFDEAARIEEADIVVVDAMSFNDENLFMLSEVRDAIVNGKEVVSSSDGVPFTWTAGDLTFGTKLRLWPTSGYNVEAYIDSPVDKFKFLPSSARIFLDGKEPDALDYTSNHFIPSPNDRCCYVRWRNLYF